MLGNVVLVLLQIAAAIGGGPFLYAMIPARGDWGLFVYAAVFAVIVFVIGLLGSLVLKGVARPSPASFLSALLFALLAAAVVTYGPQLVAGFPGHAIAHRNVVLAGAIIGYFLRR